MLDEIVTLQLITAKLGFHIVSLEIEITSAMRHTKTTKVFFSISMGSFTSPGIDTR